MHRYKVVQDGEHMPFEIESEHYRLMTYSGSGLFAMFFNGTIDLGAESDGEVEIEIKEVIASVDLGSGWSITTLKEEPNE